MSGLEVAMPLNEMALPLIDSGEFAVVMRFVYAVFQLAELSVMEVPQPLPVESAMPEAGYTIELAEEVATHAMLLPFQPSTWPAMPVPYNVEVASGAVVAPFTTAPSTPAFWVPKEVTLLEPVVVITPESEGTVVTEPAEPVMLMLMAEEVAMEATVFAPVA